MGVRSMVIVPSGPIVGSRLWLLVSIPVPGNEVGSPSNLTLPSELNSSRALDDFDLQNEERDHDGKGECQV